MQLEAGAFGGDLNKLMASVKTPTLLLPAGNDAPWKEDQESVQELKKNAPAFDLKEFPEMKHGWSVRGDLTDPAVRRDVELAFDKAKDFLGMHMAA